MALKVAVYCRVSTDDQAGSKTIENQVDFARRYCDLNGLEIYDIYSDDGVSGAVPLENRPAGSRMMADALGGRFGAVYVYRLDRLARTALDILRTHQRLSDANVALRSMTENFDTSTPSGKFFMTTLGGIAEIERETIAERMRLGKDRALREGRWPGGQPPYGYSLAGRRLAVNEEEAGVVRSIFRLYSRGGMSTGSIADYLNATGVPSPGSKGEPSGKKRWHGSRVWSILNNSAYRGLFLLRRRVREGPVELRCPPIVPGDDWEAARAVFQKNSLDARRNSRREYLLRGLIRCGLCGRTYCGDGSGKEGRHCYYRCAGSTLGRGVSPRCRARSVRADLIEDIVWKDVCLFVLNAGNTLARIGEMMGRDGEITPPDPGELDAIDAAIRSKEKERRRIIGFFRQAVITEEEAKGELAGIARELEVLEKCRHEILGRGGCDAVHEDVMLLLRQKLLSVGQGEKRDLVRGLVEGIVVNVEDCRGKPIPRVTISYVFGGFPGCALLVETRGKYRLGVPKSPY